MIIARVSTADTLGITANYDVWLYLFVMLECSEC